MEKLDSQLLKEIAKGDSKSFESLLKKYKNKVFGLCKKMVHDKHISEELCQDVWIQVIKFADSFQGDNALSWIMVITRNICLNYLKKQSRWYELSPEDETNIPDQSASIDELLMKETELDKLKGCIDKLPEKQRVAVSIVFTEELSHSEIAKLMDLSVSNIKVVLFRAREGLINCMGILL